MNLLSTTGGCRRRCSRNVSPVSRRSSLWCRIWLNRQRETIFPWYLGLSGLQTLIRLNGTLSVVGVPIMCLCLSCVIICSLINPQPLCPFCRIILLPCGHRLCFHTDLLMVKRVFPSWFMESMLTCVVGEYVCSEYIRKGHGGSLISISQCSVSAETNYQSLCCQTNTFFALFKVHCFFLLLLLL